MPWWVSAISLGLKLMGLTSWAEGLLTQYEAKQQGKRDQAALDTASTLQTVEREQEADSKAPKTKQAEIDRLKEGTG